MLPAQLRFSTSIRLDPRGGYFFADKLAAGLTLAYDFQKSNVGSSFSEPSQSLGIGPFVRYYFLPTEKRVNILAEVNGAYSRVFDADAGALQYGFLGGIALFLNSTVALELLPGYRAYNTYGDVKSKKNSFVMNIGSNINHTSCNVFNVSPLSVRSIFSALVAIIQHSTMSKTWLTPIFITKPGMAAAGLPALLRKPGQ